MNCANCGHSNDADAEFCENCGTALARTCRQCGSPLNPGARFCKKCGTPVNQTASPAGAPGEQRQRLAALQQAAPPDLRDKIRASSAHSEGERKPVTILFTDIVGSTAMAEKLDPEEWKEIVSGAHQRVSDAVYRYEGTIAQLLGDGVLAFFGAPITHEDDPLRAVQAALDLQQAIAAYAVQLRGYTDDFQMRAGIHTGTVVVGQMGSDLHLEYLAIGDAVNLAARLQSAARPGRVLISDTTARQVKAAFALNALGDISLKGKAEPVNVFEVIEPKAAPASGRGLEGLRSPLVGRDRELGLLNAALLGLTAGSGQIVTVLGEAGIGKSRLVEEGRRSHSDLRWLEGRALSYGQPLSFWSIVQFIKHDLGLLDGDPEARLKVALRRRAKALFGEQADDTFPYLALVLGIELEPEAAQRLHALDEAALKGRIHAAISGYFARLAEEKPTVLVFEDLHWADPSTLQALEQLFALTDRAPLLLLLLARAERDQGWWAVKLRAETDYAHRYTEIALKLLTADEQNQLVDNLLAVAELPDATRRLMLERSEGNPFYLEEVIRSLIEQGALVSEGEHWRATDALANVEIPDTLHGVLLARIDRLSDDVRHTLQAASVIGKSFLYRLLEAIAEADRQLDAHLSELQRMDLVLEKARRPDLEYIFKHSLTQAAAYDSLLLERRKEFHRRVGWALERLYSDRLEEVLGLLAYHFGRAGQQEKSLEYANRAGDRARELFAYREAIDFYRQALVDLKEQKDFERAARMLMKIGLLYHMLFEFARSHEAYEEGFVLWRQADASAPAALPPAPHALRMPAFNPITLDPGLDYDTDSDAVIDQLFSGLVELTPELDIIPDIAHRWDALDGGQKYVFHLRDDARWSDGTPVTAHDFEFAWKRALHPQTGSPAAHVLYAIKGARVYHHGRAATPQDVGVRALDDFTLEVELESPTGYFLHLLTFDTTLPVPRHSVEKHGPAWTQPRNIVTNGPFLLVDWQPNQSLTLSRNLNYRGRFAGNVQRIALTLPFAQNTALELYEAGSLDVTFVPFTEFDELRRRHAAEYVAAPWASLRHILFDVTNPPFDDVRVRRAFAYAIDRDTLANQILSGVAAPATGGFVPPGIPGHSPGIGLAYDPERARRELADAGYPNGLNFPQVDLLSVPYPAFARAAEYAKDQWQANLGVAVNLRVSSAANPDQEANELVSRGQVGMFAGGWLADYPDADNFLRVFIATFSKWRNGTYEQLIESAGRISEPSERIKLYQAADRILIEAAAVVPLIYMRHNLLVKPWISHYRPSPLRHWHWKDVVIEPH